MKNNNIESLFLESIAVKKACVKQGFSSISIMGDQICDTLQNNGK